MNRELINNDDYRLWRLCHQTYDAMVRARANELRQFGISPVQATVLLILKAAKAPVTPADISRWLFRETHSVSELVNRMERKGLVRKVRDLERKNLVRVAMTEKGEEAYQRSREMKVIHTILSGLSPEERNSMVQHLEKLRHKAVTELGMDYKLPFP